MLLLDFFLLIMIGVCIVYSWMLNRRIQSLQDSRTEFVKMLKELNTSIVKAGVSITDLRDLSISTATELVSLTEDAKKTSNQLMAMNDIGNNITQNLSEKIAAIQENTNNINSEINNKENDDSIEKKSELYFDDNDLVNEEQQDKIHHINQLNKTIPTIVTKSLEDKVNLNQLNYYDTLRKINEKK